MKFAIIGSGSVGLTLAGRLHSSGHTVTFASRDPSSAKAVAAREATHGSIPFGAVQPVVAPAEIVVLATQFADAQAAITEAGSLVGKILVDTTNPIKRDLSGLTTESNESAAEQIARWAIGARVVKAFNMTGFNIIENPHFPSGSPAMFICGDDPEAKAATLRIAAEIGFDAIDAGPLAEARLLEPMAMLWIKLAYARGLGRDIAFALLRR